MPWRVVGLEQRICHRFGTAQQQRSAGLGIHKQFEQRLVLLGIQAIACARKDHFRGVALAGIQQRPGPAVGRRQAARVLRFQELEGSRQGRNRRPIEHHVQALAAGLEHFTEMAKQAKTSHIGAAR